MQLVLLHWMKYAVQGHIILKSHKARRRRQTQRTNPRYYLFWILNRPVTSKIFSISKTFKKSSL